MKYNPSNKTCKSKMKYIKPYVSKLEYLKKHIKCNCIKCHQLDTSIKTNIGDNELGKVYVVNMDSALNQCQIYNSPFFNNPHLLQYGKIVKSSKPIDRILRNDAKEKEYVTRKNVIKSVNHWGQRKLLLSEIEFLTLYIGNDRKCEKDSRDMVIYAGAAGGDHIPFLSNLFSHVKFILIDPAKFNIKESKNIKIINDYFTDDMAKKLFKMYNESYDIYFISDIRTGCWKTQTSEKVEESVENDMRAQEKWVKILKPKMSMLKFRLPYCSPEKIIKEYKYLKGDIYLPIWGPQTTTETRLITDGKEETIYNPKKYESQMFYFNTETRVMYYEHDKKYSEDEYLKHSYDNCYDCESELRILENYLSYLKKFKEEENKSDKNVLSLSNKISNCISRYRKLSDISYINKE